MDDATDNTSTRGPASGGPPADLTVIRATYDLLPLLAWSCRADGHCDYLNRRWVEYTGVPEELHHGTGWLSAVHPDDRAGTLATWDGFISGTAEYDVDYRLRRHDGAYRWFKTRGVLLRSEGGAAARVVGTTTDVHDQKRAEGESRSILESISDAFFALDRDWRFTYVNREAERLLGRTRDDLVGKDLWEEYPPAVGTEFERNYRRAAAEGVAVAFEAFYPPHDRWYEVNAYPSPAGLSVYFRDVNDRKRAEAAVAESEARYRTLFTAMDQGFCVVEVQLDHAGRAVDYRFLEVNPAFENHTGLVNAAGRTARELVPDLDPFWFDTYGRVAATGEPVRFEHHAAAMDGRWFDVYAFRVGEPAARRVAILFTDVTARKRAEEAVRANEAWLQTVSDSLPALVGYVDSGLVYRFVNRAYVEWFGATVADVVGRHIRDVLGEESFAQRRPHVEAALRGQVVRFEGPTRHATLGVRQTDLVLTPYRAGGAVTGFFVHGVDVTDQREAERRLELAVEIAQMGTFEIDLLTDAVTVNEPGRAIYGWASPRTTFAQVQAHFHPDDKADVMAAVGRAFDPAGPGTFEVEQRIVRTDGQVRWIRVRGRAVFDGDGAARRAVRCVGAYLDVTDRKQAEERFRAFMDHSPAASWVTDEDGTVRFLSATYAKMFRLPAGDLLGARPTDLYPEELAREYVENIRAVARSGEPLRTVERAPRPDGSMGEFLVYKFPLPGSGHIGGVAVDITDQRRAEQALRASEDEARRQLAELNAIYATAPLGLGVFDRQVRYIRINQRLAEINGVPVEGHLGRTVWEVVPDLADQAAAIHREVLTTGRTARGEFRGVTKADPGAPRVWDSFWFPVAGSDGSPEAVAIIVEDVTAAREAEEAIREADRRKDEFLATLAHELRNPLAPIRNGLQVLRLAGGSGEAAERARAMMDRQLSHMVRLVDDLLDVSRISRGKLELRRERLLLSDVIASAVETARPAIDAGRHTLDVSLPPEPVDLDADLTRLSQVFSNLLTNSAKYTPPGGHIRLSVERTERAAVVVVRDTGIGIPPDALPRVFELFSQVDRSLERNTGGLGIGLAIVKGLVEMHGGSVTAESGGLGQGSTFTVTLPLGAAEVAASEPDASAVRAGPARRILVVDDNRDSCESMAELLTLLGHQVETAYDGVEAVAAAEAFRPDFVLMDVGMPRMNGYDATRRIRERPWGKAVTVVAVTGWGQDGDREQSAKAGCDGHLVKPVDVAELSKLLAERKR